MTDSGYAMGVAGKSSVPMLGIRGGGPILVRAVQDGTLDIRNLPPGAYLVNAVVRTADVIRTSPIDPSQ